jgi:hypothetical protein
MRGFLDLLWTCSILEKVSARRNWMFVEGAICLLQDVLQAYAAMLWWHLMLSDEDEIWHSGFFENCEKKYAVPWKFTSNSPIMCKRCMKWAVAMSLSSNVITSLKLGFLALPSLNSNLFPSCECSSTTDIAARLSSRELQYCGVVALIVAGPKSEPLPICHPQHQRVSGATWSVTSRLRRVVYPSHGRNMIMVKFCVKDIPFFLMWLQWRTVFPLEQDE